MTLGSCWGGVWGVWVPSSVSSGLPSAGHGARGPQLPVEPLTAEPLIGSVNTMEQEVASPKRRSEHTQARTRTQHTPGVRGLEHTEFTAQGRRYAKSPPNGGTPGVPGVRGNAGSAGT